jgi:hypothetical protein
MRQRSVTCLCVSFLIFITATSAHAQVVQEYVSDLLAPMRLSAQPDGSLLVSEAGTGANNGRISLIDRDGRRFTVIDGLPSGLFGGTDASGPAGVLLRGQRLFILIGGGNVVIAGPAPGSELPNPNPASPLFNSVLLVELTPDQTTLPLGFTFSPDAHGILAGGGAVYIGNGRGEQIRVSRLVDFPDFVAEPRPDVPANVRGANTFGLVGSDAHLDIVDAAQNLVYGVDVASRTAVPTVRFAPVPNPLAPMGPPMVDAVPASIRGSGDSLIVSFLTGFPFGPGAASVQVIDRFAGTSRTLISGLQTAIDTAPSASPEGQTYVLEYSRSFLTGGAGRLLRFDSATGRPIVITDTLATPTSVAIDPRSGDLWVSELRAGRIVRVLAPR